METKAAALVRQLFSATALAPARLTHYQTIVLPAMIGTPAQVFPSTHWSVVLATHTLDPNRAREALQQLCTAYWYPLYAYLRRRGHQPADAEDLVQGFIAHLLSNQFFTSAVSDKGRFRSYLLAALNHFVADTVDHAHRQKRGDGKPLLSLDAIVAEHRYALEPANPDTPEQLFERRWALTLLDNVLRQLESEAAASGRADLFARLKGVLLGDRGVSYAELAPQLGLSEAALSMTVHRLRRHYRELVCEEIAHTVSRPVEIEEEMRHLFKILSG